MHSMITTREDGYLIDTDPARLDLDLIHHWLSTDAYWCLGRDRDTVERAAAGSVNFGVYDRGGAQVAYARVVTDRATFAWLADVYLEPERRGRGLARWLVDVICRELEPYRLTRILLATRDAHGLYAQSGFAAYPQPERLMMRAG